MSNRTEKKIIPAVPASEREFVVGQSCDRCWKDVPAPLNYERRVFTLEYLTGESYPESTDLHGWEVLDCCDECAEFLKDLLLTNGFKVSEATRY